MIRITTLALAVLFTFWYPVSVAFSEAAPSEAEKQMNVLIQEDEYFKLLTPMIPYGEKQLECLALNIYHEARNETDAGKMAVSFVTLNRVHSDMFPNSVCEVVYQGRISKWHLENTGKVVPLRNKCQFSWYCDGKSDKVYEADKFEEARKIAYYILTSYGKVSDITHGALWYHADYVNPNWADDYTITAKIDTHIFYKQ
jgi:spore germination cell wall hydrolase CwlJ-like protein